MPNESDRAASQSCCRHALRQPSVLIEGALIGGSAIEAGDPDGPHAADEVKSKDEADLVLPPRDTKRWSSRRKAAVLVAVRTGVMTREEARQRYLISEEELAGWEVAFDRAGIPGLRVTRPQSYRRAGIAHARSFDQTRAPYAGSARPTE